MFIPLPSKHGPNHQSEAPCTHSYCSTGVQELSTIRIGSVAKRRRWAGGIERDNDMGQLVYVVAVIPVEHAHYEPVKLSHYESHQNGSMIRHRMDVPDSRIDVYFYAMSSVLQSPRSCKVVRSLV